MRLAIRLLQLLCTLLWKPIGGCWRFLSDPAKAGAASAFLFSGGLAISWILTAIALEGETRPSPIELAELASDHSSLWLWVGVIWFAVHTLAIPFAIGVFLTHAEGQRPALWFFALFMSLAVLLWMCFGALSVPLGSNAGPVYHDAKDRADLSVQQQLLWRTPCDAGEVSQSLSGLSALQLAELCPNTNEPLLLAVPHLRATIGAEQIIPIQEAWSAAHDAWTVRKISDAVFFGGNGVFILAMLFFCVFVVRSPVLTSFSFTLAAAAGILYAVGFAAFFDSRFEIAVFAAITCHILWLGSVGVDLWDSRYAGRFSVEPSEALLPATEVLALDVPLTHYEVRDILECSDLRERNRRITVAYARLARQLNRKIAGQSWDSVDAANWFHFGVWASKSVGSYIERPRRPIEGLRERALVRIENDLQRRSGEPPLDEQAAEFERGSFTAVRARSNLSTAMADGNRLVFEQLAPLFVDFLSGGDPKPEARELQLALAAYREAASVSEVETGCLEVSSARRTELMLKANLLLVEYEQRRLDRVIGEALDGGMDWPVAFLYPGPLVRCGYRLFVLPFTAIWFASLRKPVRQSALEQERCLVATLGRWFVAPFRWGLVRRVSAAISAETITLTVGSAKPERLNVGDDLRSPSRAGLALVDIKDPDLKRKLETRARKPGKEVKVDDYKRLEDRMRFIQNLFWTWQCDPRVREDPYSDEEKHIVRFMNLQAGISLSRAFRGTGVAVAGAPANGAIQANGGSTGAVPPLSPAGPAVITRS